MVPPLRSSLLAGMPHAFSGRDGLASGVVLSDAQTVRVKQVHSATVVTADEALAASLEADAIVTDRANLALTIITADCAPVLLADEAARVIGAAHAGWRGAVGGILGHTVARMVDLGAEPSRIIAAIGPTIAQANYEVELAFRDRFEADAARFFAPGREGHLQFDLPGYCRQRLTRAGVEQIEDLAEDTYAQPARFHSYRRATHGGQATSGRQTSAIALSHG